MHRSNLLAQLEEYRSRYPNEQLCIQRFVDLIEAEPNCFERDCWVPGHITGSAWLVDARHSRLLLTHHRKLNIWVQLGGHSDGDANTPEVALREAQEESGLPVRPLAATIFDLDIHEIPARKSDPAHYHFDVRYVFVTEHDDFLLSDESHELAWVAIEELETKTQEVSILRMRDKWLQNRSMILRAE
jgi:8-oxo-dGTP pyrophosphatase MutT (NUDIX family)